MAAGAPFQWAALFRKESLRFIKGVDDLMFYNTKIDTEEYHLPCKVSCSKCHTHIADEGRHMWMAFPTLFNFGGSSTPEAFQADCHIFYKSRRLDIIDGKDKWAGVNGKSDQIQEA